MVIKNQISDFIIEPQELIKLLSSENISVIDCRWFLNQSKKGKEEYNSFHIHGAIFFDIEKISDQKSNLPHMFPKKEIFFNFININGIKRDDFIIIYDQCGLFCSARVWLTFNYFGFKNIKILNGGIEKWCLKKFPVTNLKTKRKKIFNSFNPIKKQIIITKKNIQESIRKKNKNLTIIDARPKNRYLGLEPEPRPGLMKGHIKSSINIPFNSILKKNGCLKEIKKLKKLIFYDYKLNKNHNIICYCGSGVTACNIFLILKIFGFRNIKLYDGSWAEWGKKNLSQS